MKALITSHIFLIESCKPGGSIYGEERGKRSESENMGYRQEIVFESQRPKRPDAKYDAEQASAPKAEAY